MEKTQKCSSLILVWLCLYSITLLQVHGGGFSVEIIHHDSPQSPFYRATQTHFERVMNAMHRSINRAYRIHQASNSPKSSVVPDEGGFLMRYAIGTPPFELYGEVDTGSSFIWLQCQPCKACFNQTTTIFDPSRSNTYNPLPCSSSICQSMGSAACSGNTCGYTISYWENQSHSTGDLSQDTLTLGSTQGSPIQFPNTVIGCGHDNVGTFERKTSGVVGLGGGPLSLISQMNYDRFSYCLVPLFSPSNTSSKLNFGDAAVVSGVGTVSTPISIFHADFYFVTLEAFSVGNKRIELRRSSFGPHGPGNIIIDSGTTLTLLPDDVYKNLESAVADAMHSYQRTPSPDELFTLCYQKTSDKFEVPVITAHFRGADVPLKDINTFAEVAEGIVCLAFTPSGSSRAIFGSLAQQNFLVGYDVEIRVLSFKPTDCIKHG